MKKICFVTTIFLTYLMFLKNFSEYLHESGEYDISLICNPEPCIENELPDYVHYFPVKMKRGVSFSGFTAIKQIQNILIENSFDIVQYSTPNAAFYSSIASKRANIPVRLYCQWGIRYMGFSGWRRIIFKQFEKITCRYSTFIEAESHSIRNFSINERLYAATRSCVIWNGSASGVDLTKFDIAQRSSWRYDIRQKYNFSNDDTVFAFAGRLTADKGVNELLQAFLNISYDHPYAKLMIMGGMDDNNSLNKKIMQCAELSNQIIFTGSVPDIERYYAAADVFVAPSYREGFGLVVVEAEAMGLPAIVSDVPGQIDAIILEQTGITCKVQDVSTLEAAMLRFICEPDLKLKLGICAAEFAKNNYEQKKLFSYLKEHRDILSEQTGGAGLCPK